MKYLLSIFVLALALAAPVDPVALDAQAQWGDRDRGCGHVRRECAGRWGWGGRHYERCVVRRGCPVGERQQPQQQGPWWQQRPRWW